MNKKDKSNVVDFKPKENNEEIATFEDDENIPIASQYFEIPEDFIYTEENINVVLTLIGIYRMMGLENEIAVAATCDFVDTWGMHIGLVPETE
jgi:hypothetical protein